jgi:hypothetical protein
MEQILYPLLDVVPVPCIAELVPNPIENLPVLIPCIAQLFPNPMKSLLVLFPCLAKKGFDAFRCVVEGGGQFGYYRRDH